MQRQSIPLALCAALALTAGSVCLAAKADTTAPALAAASPAKPGTPPAAPKRIDINSASRAELKTLPGIGDAEADRIVKARPYLSKANLVSGNVLSYQLYQGLTGRIVAVQKAPPSKPKP